MSLQTLLHQTVSIQRRSTTAYMDGTPVRGNYAEVATSPCRLSAGGGGETLTINSDQRENYHSGVVFLPPDAEVLPSDMLLIDGTLYEAVYPRMIHGATRPHHLEVDVRVISAT